MGGYNIAAAAAKINAELQAKKGIQHADVPPIHSVSRKIQLDFAFLQLIDFFRLDRESRNAIRRAIGRRRLGEVER